MEGTTSVVEKVIGEVPNLFELANTCFNAVIDNPILLMFFSVGLIGTGLGIFSMLKNTAKG